MGSDLEGRTPMRKAMGPWGQVFCRVRKTTVNFSMCLPLDRRMKSLSGMQVVISQSEPGIQMLSLGGLLWPTNLLSSFRVSKVPGL